MIFTPYLSLEIIKKFRSLSKCFSSVAIKISNPYLAQPSIPNFISPKKKRYKDEFQKTNSSIQFRQQQGYVCRKKSLWCLSTIASTEEWKLDVLTDATSWRCQPCWKWQENLPSNATGSLFPKRDCERPTQRKLDSRKMWERQDLIILEKCLKSLFGTAQTWTDRHQLLL